MELWDTSTWIAIIALVVSALGFVTSVWSAWVSHRGLAHARVKHTNRKDGRVSSDNDQLYWK